MGITMTSLTFDEYQADAAKTAIYPGRKTVMGLAYAALGLGEAGEVQNKVKKVLRDAGSTLTPERRSQIADELGDLLWYLSATSDEIDIPLEWIARVNLEKLADRATRGVIKGEGDKR